MIKVLDIISGNVHELAADTRCIAAPPDMDRATGAAVAVAELTGRVHLMYRGLSERRPQVSERPWRIGDVCSDDGPILVESTDVDDRGRRLWWLSEVVA